MRVDNRLSLQPAFSTLTGADRLHFTPAIRDIGEEELSIPTAVHIHINTEFVYI